MNPATTTGLVNPMATSAPSPASSSAPITMFDPTGQLRDVSADKVPDALRSGGERAILFNAPDGQQRWVRISQVQQARASGGEVVPTGAPMPTGTSRSLTQRDRFLDPDLYPVGQKGEGTGENFKNIAQRAGVGVFQTANAAVHPRQTVASILASLLPEPIVRGANKLVDLENKIPGAHYLTTHLPEGTTNPFQQAYRAVSTSRGPMELLGKAAPLAGQALAGEAFEVAVPEIYQGVKSGAETVARAATDTGAGPVKRLVKSTQAENKTIDAVNQDRIVTQQKAQAEADAKYREKVSNVKQKYVQDVQDAEKDAQTGTDADRAKYQSKQLAAKQKFDKAVADAKSDHAEAVAAAQKAQEFNTGAEATLALRRQHEQALQQQTAEYYAKEEAADARAKSEENSAWAAWRQKMAGRTLDGGQISEPLAKLRVLSPEVERTLHQLEPRGDEVPQESSYAQLREHTSQTRFGKDYESLSPAKQGDVDDLLHAAGEFPDLIAFDPRAGQPIPIEQVHRVSSILQRYIRSGRFEGPLLGEMKQVAKVLRSAITRASADAGATADLAAVRNSTITYQGAFGKELRKPTTTRANLEKQANPAAFREREEEARLARTRQYDPTLVDSYRQVKATREALKKFPAEDQLRKGLQQVTPPGKLNLPQLRLSSGEPAPRAVNLPPTPVFSGAPTIPLELKPKLTISAGDISAARDAASEASAGKWWTRGRWAAAAPVIWAMRGFFGGHIPSIPMVGIESGGLLAATHAAASLLRYPPMVDFLIKARPEDLALIPPELRGDLPGLVTQAQRAGIKVSPTLVAAIAGVAGQQQNQQRPTFTPAQAIQAMQPAGAVQ